jgi:hypothetical protein
MKSVSTSVLAALTFVVVFAAVMFWPKLNQAFEPQVKLGPLTTTVPDTFEPVSERNRFKSQEQLTAEQKTNDAQMDTVIENTLRQDYPDADMAAMKNDAPGAPGYANFVTLRPMDRKKSKVANNLIGLNIACGSVRIEKGVFHLIVGYDKDHYITYEQVEYPEWIETGCAKAIEGPDSRSMSLKQMSQSFAQLIPDDDLKATRKQRLDFRLDYIGYMAKRPGTDHAAP